MESCQYTAGEREKTETIGELYMASIYMDSEGHLADVAVVPMGLLTYYLNQYPTASNQIAATMLTGLPETGTISPDGCGTTSIGCGGSDGGGFGSAADASL